MPLLPTDIALRPRDIRLHLGLLSVYFLMLALLLFAYGYQGSFLLLNSAHNAFGDAIIPHLSNLGDSLILASLVTVLTWRRDPALAMMGILTVAATGILAQILKRNFFSDWDRPLYIFAEMAVPIHSFPHEQLRHNSFPSGHSTTAVAGLTVLAYHYRTLHQSWQGLTALVTILVCHARTYMGVHFPGDVLAGGLLALLCTLAAVRWLYPVLRRWTDGKSAAWHHRAAQIMLILGTLALLAGCINRYRYLFA